ncbi:hypothetical protein BDQ17DRAFT_1330127 [Cyathus striatus]|nr:hypothetical protein BDQ17DRAFT_1330127 [Cyathus striatus]
MTISTTVTTSLSYVVPPEGDTKLYFSSTEVTATGDYKSNITRRSETVQVENLRGKEDSVTLDTAGFQYFKRAPKHKDFTDDAAIEKEYYPESIELYKELTGASKVVIFDHTVRRNNPENSGNDPKNRKPAAQVHVDQTKKAAVARVHRHVPEEAESLLKKRFQIVNLWRPIKHAAYDVPLALCDYRSVDTKNDTLPVALIYPNYEGETMGIKYNPNHKWKYLRGMTPEEGVLIKCSDSIEDENTAIFTPHTAFIDPSTPEGSPPRESIELRALVFYD